MGPRPVSGDAGTAGQTPSPRTSSPLSGSQFRALPSAVPVAPRVSSIAILERPAAGIGAAGDPMVLAGGDVDVAPAWGLVAASPTRRGDVWAMAAGSPLTSDRTSLLLVYEQ